MDNYLKAIVSHADNEAFIWNDLSWSYSWLVEKIDFLEDTLNEYAVEEGCVVEIIGDCSPVLIALLFALIKKKCIVIPLTPSSLKKQSILHQIVNPDLSIVVNNDEGISVTRHHHALSEHQLLIHLKTRHHPGLILFSSGSTGQPKAIVHDWCLLLKKYRPPYHPKRVLAFLLFDHIGGLNTILHTLFHGGTVIIPESLTTEAVCQAIALYKAAVLPTSPTFLNLLIINKSYLTFDLNSLKLITYGTEAMDLTLLKTLGKIFPAVRFLQTYGLSELGILHVLSQSSDSLLVKPDEKSYQVRVNNGMLEIKTKTAMLGYLNAESPFTKDGWFKTGDVVRQEGDYMHILGRASEIINIGGLKVYPLQVENVIRQMEFVEDVIVVGESNAITGHIVKAAVQLSCEESVFDFRKRMRRFCKDQLQDFEIPQKVVLVEQFDYGDRIKKMRKMV